MNRAFLFLCFASFGFATAAHAESLYVTGSSGIRDQANSNCFDPFLPTGELVLLGGAFCTATYPIALPVGKTIDSVEIAYGADSAFPSSNITGSIVQNLVTPYVGADVVAKASFGPVWFGHHTLLVPTKKGIPVVGGKVYWVEVSTTDISQISYVEVTYH